ncbi:MAG: acetyltransferase [Firmicutes bacterium]|nr:acetyltransferase [Bacillota bacterium]
MDKVIIIGGKGSAIVVAEQIYDTQVKRGDVEFLGFAFDDDSKGNIINGFPILCKTYEAHKKYDKYDDIKFIYQLYRPDLMKERIDLLNSFQIEKEKFYTFVHHTATVSRSAKIGNGTVIMANVVVNPNTVIGNHCTIHSNTLIGHDTRIGDNNFVAAHNVVGSSSEIGNANFFGLNSTFNNYLKIGDYNFVGMASNVVKNINSNQKVYGNPAKEFYKDIKPL